jgi:hypothetical protein
MQFPSELLIDEEARVRARTGGALAGIAGRSMVAAMK